MLRIALVLIALAGSALAAPDLKQLGKDRVAAAEKAYRGTLVGLKTGRAAAEAAYTWSVRWLDADLAAGKTAKLALADHLARMTLLEAELDKAKTSGQASAFDHDATIYFKVEATIWAARGKR
jgi:predicted amidohydrolase